jgi:hypothetical protein
VLPCKLNCKSIQFASNWTEHTNDPPGPVAPRRRCTTSQLTIMTPQSFGWFFIRHAYIDEIRIYAALQQVRVISHIAVLLTFLYRFFALLTENFDYD